MRVKETDNEQKSHDLTKQEFNYLKAITEARNRVYEEQGRVISAFLYYISTNRLGYKPGVDLEFEIDFDKGQTLKIKQLPTEQASPKQD